LEHFLALASEQHTAHRICLPSRKFWEAQQKPLVAAVHVHLQNGNVTVIFSTHPGVHQNHSHHSLKPRKESAIDSTVSSVSTKNFIVNLE
jgi:hypothetical protein